MCVGIGRERILDELADPLDRAARGIGAGSLVGTDTGLGRTRAWDGHGHPRSKAWRRQGAKALCIVNVRLERANNPHEQRSSLIRTEAKHREIAGSESFLRVSGKLRAFGVEWDV